jgi:hypothetical protein
VSTILAIWNTCFSIVDAALGSEGNVCNGKLKTARPSEQLLNTKQPALQIYSPRPCPGSVAPGNHSINRIARATDD